MSNGDKNSSREASTLFRPLPSQPASSSALASHQANHFFFFLLTHRSICFLLLSVLRSIRAPSLLGRGQSIPINPLQTAPLETKEELSYWSFTWSRRPFKECSNDLWLRTRFIQSEHPRWSPTLTTCSESQRVCSCMYHAHRESGGKREKRGFLYVN